MRDLFRGIKNKGTFGFDPPTLLELEAKNVQDFVRNCYKKALVKQNYEPVNCDIFMRMLRAKLNFSAGLTGERPSSTVKIKTV